MKVYDSLEEKVKHILDDVIKNLEPSHYIRIQEVLLTEDLRINDLILKAKSLLIQTKLRPFGRYYWIARGWSVAVAQAKILEIRKKQKPRKSPFSCEFWLEKINPDTNAFFTLQEAEFKRNSIRPIRPEYWIIRGFSKEDAVQKAKSTKAENNLLGAKSVKSRNKDELKSFSRRSVEYWLARGFSLEDARTNVKTTQSTFSLKKCIEKHGDEKGQQLWKQRQDKWQDTLNSKTHEEIADIARRKISTKGRCLSKAEIQLFDCLKLIISGIERQIVLANGRKRFIYDIGFNKKLIEYNGTYWHADPRFYKGNDTIGRKKLTAEQVWDNDYKKLKTAQEQGYEVLIIWEHDFKENKQREIEKCIKFLTQ